MAQWQLGRHEQSRNSLDEAHQRIESPAFRDLDWQVRAETEVLANEAESLIGK